MSGSPVAWSAWPRCVSTGEQGGGAEAAEGLVALPGRGGKGLETREAGEVLEGSVRELECVRSGVVRLTRLHTFASVQCSQFIPNSNL